MRYADGDIANKADRRSEFWLIGGGDNRRSGRSEDRVVRGRSWSRAADLPIFIEAGVLFLKSIYVTGAGIYGFPCISDSYIGFGFNVSPSFRKT